jgi:hypothetical protein
MHLGYKKSPLKDTREGSYHNFLKKSARGRQIRQINSAISKVPDGAWNSYELDTDSCRGTVPMQPFMSNCSMHHRELLNVKSTYDTRMVLQGASCTSHKEV